MFLCIEITQIFCFQFEFGCLGFTWLEEKLRKAFELFHRSVHRALRISNIQLNDFCACYLSGILHRHGHLESAVLFH